jgi:hypothetical protein
MEMNSWFYDKLGFLARRINPMGTSKLAFIFSNVKSHLHISKRPPLIYL